MNKNINQKKGNQNILSFIGIGMAFISIGISIYSNIYAREANHLAVEANEIAREQLPLRVVILNSKFLKSVAEISGDPGGGETVCTFSFLMDNLGDVATSIVGFRTNISFGGSSVLIGSQTNVVSDELGALNHIGGIEALLLKAEYSNPELSSEPSSDFFLPLPTTIEAGQKLEVFTWFLYTTYLVDFKTPPSSYIREDYSPVQVIYTFIMQNGEEVNAPPVTCYYMKP